jgi:molecular chaperone HtpG
MSDESMERIPFEVDVNRVIEVLSSQIYQTPLALLRENAQNAFDAILLRRHLGQEFLPQIQVSISDDEIAIADNGIGMTPEDLRNHYWHAGSSGKNNPEARAAGVVGTFGIGAMANFGIAHSLELETESALSGARTRSSAQRETLSAT